MARTGPRRNQYTGPVQPVTLANRTYKKHEAFLLPAKRKKPNDCYYHYKTPQKAQVQAIVQ